MAKYTELFAEYLQDGGALPSSSFALIEGFEDLFKERFCDCEIGYETPALFAIKLDARAKVVMPLFADKLAIVEAQIAKLKADSPKTRNEERIYGKQHSATDNKAHELPFDEEPSTPSSTATGTADVDEHKDNVTITETTGFKEKLEALEMLKGRAYSVKEECLREFENLFMKVY